MFFFKCTTSQILKYYGKRTDKKRKQMKFLRINNKRKYYWETHHKKNIVSCTGILKIRYEYISKKKTN